MDAKDNQKPINQKVLDMLDANVGIINDKKVEIDISNIQISIIKGNGLVKDSE